MLRGQAPFRNSRGSAAQTVKYGSKQRHKLYVCNVPRTMPRQTLLETFRGLVRGVVELDVTTQKDQGRPEENRGFCFIEMYNQAAAEAAMPVLTSPDLVFAGECAAQLICHLFALRSHDGRLAVAGGVCG